MIYQGFPQAVRVGDREYPIRTDFRDVLELLFLLSDPDTTGQEMVLAVLDLYTGEVPADLEAAVTAVQAFLLPPGDGEPQDDRPHKRALSYQQDAPYLVADFLREYRIDLTDIPYLHWQKFQMLLQGLSGKSETQQRMTYRLMDVGQIKDRQERERILKFSASCAFRTARWRSMRSAICLAGR